MELFHTTLGGGFNPSEKYESKWEYSPNFGVNIKKYLKPPPNLYWIYKHTIGLMSLSPII